MLNKIVISGKRRRKDPQAVTFGMFSKCFEISSKYTPTAGEFKGNPTVWEEVDQMDDLDYEAICTVEKIPLTVSDFKSLRGKSYISDNVRELEYIFIILYCEDMLVYLLSDT
jgi:hypothetical protein